MSGFVLSAEQRGFLGGARRGVLATVDERGLPRLVPICFALADDPRGRGGEILYSPIDEKPKRTSDPRALARVRDLLARPTVAILVDRWAEDWARIGWLRLLGRASLVEPSESPTEHADAVAALRAKYEQYADHALEARPIIRIAVENASSWGDLSEG